MSQKCFGLQDAFNQLNLAAQEITRAQKGYSQFFFYTAAMDEKTLGAVNHATQIIESSMI